MHHQDYNETLGEKGWKELHKNATCCFEQIMEAKPYKTAAVRSLTAYLPNYPNKMKKTYKVLLENLEQTHKRYSLMESHT